MQSDVSFIIIGNIFIFLFIFFYIQECFEIASVGIPHAVDLLKDRLTDVQKTHREMIKQVGGLILTDLFLDELKIFFLELKKKLFRFKHK